MNGNFEPADRNAISVEIERLLDFSVENSCLDDAVVFHLDDDAIVAGGGEAIRKIGFGRQAGLVMHAVILALRIRQRQSGHGYRPRWMNVREHRSIILHEGRVTGHAHIKFGILHWLAVAIDQAELENARLSCFKRCRISIPYDMRAIRRLAANPGRIVAADGSANEIDWYDKPRNHSFRETVVAGVRRREHGSYSRAPASGRRSRSRLSPRQARYAAG